MRLIRKAAPLAVAAAAVWSCGEGTTTPPAPVPTTLNLSATTLSFTSLNATAQLTATVLDQTGQPMTGEAVTWSTTDGTVATVSTAGLATATGNGTATVTAVVATLSKSVDVTVQQVAAALLKSGGDTQTDTVGQTLPTALEVQVNDGGGSPIATATVAFAVTAGGGALSAADVTVGANGRGSSSWTLGTVTGAQEVEATVQGTAVTATFTATAVADVADTIAFVSGSPQTGAENAVLAESLVVRVADQFGNAVDGYDVDWVVTGGGGSLSPTSVATGADGQAAAAWTLGPAGPQTAEAQATTAIVGTPVAFAATAEALSLVSVAPDPIVEGAAATLTGTGFDPTPGNNAVTVDGAVATVTSASPTSLTVTVPTFDCRPARAVGVQVSVGGASSNTVSHPLQPAGVVSLAVGEQQIVTDPAGFCLQFDASGGTEAYLVGTQSLSETPSTLTPVRLIAETGQASPVPPVLVAARSAAGPVADYRPGPQAVRWRAHLEAEASVRAADSVVWASFPRSWALGRWSQGVAATAASQLVDSTVSVGDTITDIRVWDLASACTGFDAITTVVRAKGTRGIWLEDVDNPLSGYTQADFDSLSAYFDDVIFDTDTAFFGDPGDIDQNARAVIVVTKEVNLRSSTLLGFVGSCDFFTRGQAPASNEGEFFYAKAPDPSGTFGSVYTRTSAFADAPFLIAHEFTHIIQFGRQIPANAEFTAWFLEGQATLSEEVIGHVVEGLAPGQNYGYATAFNTGNTASVDWFLNGFVDLARYFGLSLSNAKIGAAPHECTWIGRASEGNDGPCFNLRAVYGTPWSLLRWASDHFGSGFGGGVGEFQKALIDETEGGFLRLQNVLGRSADSLLAQWAASLYVDDRVGGASALLTQPSWDLFDIFEVNSPAAWRLTPIEKGFAASDQTINVRAGSSGYFRFSGVTRPATAVRARTSGDATLPATMQIWVVRLQ